MDAESIQKTLKIFNFTTTYPILMKLATYILIRSFHWQNLGDVPHRVYKGVNKKNFQNVHLLTQF